MSQFLERIKERAKADNPNILNYKTAVLNEYAEWEQDLKEREAVIREKELELDIDTANQ